MGRLPRPLRSYPDRSILACKSARIRRVRMFRMRFLVLVLVLTALAGAQTFTASLQGTVTDSTGAIVPNARVTLVNEATNVKSAKVTDSRGAYLFTQLPPGTYKMTV